MGGQYPVIGKLEGKVYISLSGHNASGAYGLTLVTYDPIDNVFTAENISIPIILFEPPWNFGSGSASPQIDDTLYMISSSPHHAESSFINSLNLRTKVFVRNISGPSPVKNSFRLSPPAARRSSAITRKL